MRHSIPAKSVQHVLEAAARRGVRALIACAAADIDQAALADPDRRLPLASVVRLYDACARLTGDASFGLHVAEASPDAILAVAGSVMLDSPTVGEALRQMERYRRLWTDGAVLRRSVNGARALLEHTYYIDDPGPEGRRQDSEATLAIVASTLRALTTAEWQPERVWFEHEAPADTSEHARLFRCAVEFGQTTNALIFSASVLAQAPPSVGADVYVSLDRPVQTLLEAIPRDGTLANRVRHVLVPAVRAGDPDLATVARALDLSTRTLQRRLHDEHTSLHHLIDDVRRDLARQYLQREDLTTADVAYLVGFNEIATFQRACRKWQSST